MNVEIFGCQTYSAKAPVFILACFHFFLGVDGVPSMNGEEDRDNERKLREERLIASMEEQLFKIHTTTNTQSSPSKRSSLSQVPLPSMASSQRYTYSHGHLQLVDKHYENWVTLREQNCSKNKASRFKW